MPTAKEKKDIIYKAGVPISGPYADSARRVLNGEYCGPVGGAEPEPNGEAGSGKKIAISGMVVGRADKPRFCR